jgi:hypothetical protein
MEGGEEGIGEINIYCTLNREFGYQRRRIEE